uniref:Ribbon-helix-helix protein CopG domain-containing protein n=1 Tax=uncultured prokaryote TaxID=198431 RepID=A0A0H5Q4V0_9ZZZZ|nr:hypothetical protein [uncultured prokaryote]
MAKKRVNISVSSDTEQRLKQYSLEHHTTVSQAITDWIWSVDVKIENKAEEHDGEEFDFEILNEEVELGFGFGNIF